MPLFAWPEFVARCPEIDLPLPGARGWLLQGAEHQTVCVEFDETVEVPVHSHADQWEFVIAGRVELHREEGTELYTVGDNFFVPAGQPHGATVYAGYRALIVFCEPERDRIRAAESEPHEED
jgi:quercetin dioxygenase-like cupin family protein